MVPINSGIIATGLSLFSLLFLFFALLNTPIIPSNSFLTSTVGSTTYQIGLYGECVDGPFNQRCQNTGLDNNGDRAQTYVFLLAMHPLGFVFSFFTSGTAVYAWFLKGHQSVVAYRAAAILSAVATMTLFLAMVEDSLIHTEINKGLGTSFNYGPAFGLVVVSFLATMASLVMFIVASEITNCCQPPQGGSLKINNQPPNVIIGNQPPVAQNPGYYATTSPQNQSHYSAQFYPSSPPQNHPYPSSPPPNHSYPSSPPPNHSYPQQLQQVELASVLSSSSSSPPPPPPHSN